VEACGVSQRDPVRVGTAGWSVPGRYLAEFPAGDTHLERYAREFPVVEIDTSFYRHHQRATYARWAASVGEEFRFAVKTPKALTHEGNLHAGASATRDRFLAEVDGLGAKLSVLLVQLPPSLVFDETATAFFADLKRALPPTVQIACEPRNLTWSTAEANDLLIGSSVSRVAADPARWEGNALPAGDQSLAYFRQRPYVAQQTGRRAR
jgi:uncharacterized protein YecE (DUF72 family)